jgi:hypothetical protein
MGKVGILWENGLGGLGRLTQIFFKQMFNLPAKPKKIRVNLPNPPNPFSHSITKHLKVILNSFNFWLNPVNHIRNLVNFTLTAPPS